MASRSVALTVGSRFHSAAWLAVMVLLTGCAVANVTTDYNPEVSFDDLATWVWHPNPPSSPLTLRPELGRMVRNAVEDELSEKGYERSTARLPDFVVSAFALAGDTEVAGTWDIYGRSDVFLWLDAGRAAHVDIYREGTLILDFLDRDLRVLWRGVTSGAVPAGDPGSAEREIAKAVERILSEFPPAP